VRQSPYKVGDRVWVIGRGSQCLSATITAVNKPQWAGNAYTYGLKNDVNGTVHTLMEDGILPYGLFHLMANDVVYLKDAAAMINQLNYEFEHQACMAFQAFRKGQKRPWAYYVIPDWHMLYNTAGAKDEDGFQVEYRTPKKACFTMKIIPISAHP